jgi:hypothetical protein
MALTSAQIVTLATQTAKCLGYTSQAGQFLNAILQDLCQTYDFETIVKTITFNFNLSQTSGPDNQYIAGCGPNPLPLDFLRCKNNEAIYYIQGVRYVMINLDQAEFDMLVQTAGFNSYPTNFYIDMAPKSQGLACNLYCWVPASGAYPVTIRYYPQMADIPTPETSSVVPWFPNQQYLLTRLAGQLMQLTNDDRYKEYLGDGAFGSEGILRKYLELKDDPEGRVNTVKLDRRRFGNSWSGLKDTKLIGW